MESQRVYADTSVFGGVFDEEFEVPSKQFFKSVQQGVFKLVVSELIRKEISEAPQGVQDFFSEMLLEADVAEITSKSLKLRDAYISAGILSPRWSDDALHVAIATVTRCTMIVSWNFQHIVNFRKMPLYSAVNTLQGYGPIAIYSPMEVVGYGKEKEEI